MILILFKQRTKLRILSLSLVLVPVLTLAPPFIQKDSFAESPLQTYCDSLSGDAKDNTVCKDSSADKDGNILSSDGVLMKAIRLLSTLTGAMAATFVIVGGIQIASSRGDSDKVKKARERIIFALIGIIVLILSNLIIRLILSIINKASGPPSSTPIPPTT